jgi:hypothetical protein
VEKEDDLGIQEFNTHSIGLVDTEQEYLDLSLESREERTGFVLETSKNKLADSLIYNTRSTSISMHKANMEIAFLKAAETLTKDFKGITN